MEYKENIKYPKAELESITEWWYNHKEYDVNEYEDYIEIVRRSDEQITETKIEDLKAELKKIKEDIEQEVFGIVRDDFAEKKARAAEIINELRVLEGKEPREIKS